MKVTDSEYAMTTTFRRSGEPVTGMTWIVALSGGRVGFYSQSSYGKIKRLRHDPRIVIRPCDAGGRVAAGAQTLHGTAVVVTSGADFDEVHAAVERKYGAATVASSRQYYLSTTPDTPGDPRPPYADVAVVVTLLPAD
ncbi:pyridoxamine 5'-phosphate oxidase family protein [Nonomuraea sp. NPDC050394]|uniref:pyridoxamine 5'-phosphate oxidase family protein n=1 Tax=Nonomuraea sp. NPDC050394 TaxID=3364363 RepID=UPI0037B3BE9C